MNSPFPGMDPYLEAHWRDVHARWIIYTCAALQADLPASLFARVEERVFFEADEVVGQSSYPDVRVVEYQLSPGRLAPTAQTDAASVLLEEPVVIHVAAEPATETYIEIIDASTGNRVVTAIEVLSPSNKIAGPGQDLYLAKQKEMLQGGVNLVEIDLIRQGERVTSLPGRQQPAKVRSLYQACVWRASRAQFEIYPIPLANRLPRIRIPLRPTDTDLRLDLQAILEQAYRNGRYFATLDYSKPLEPALAKEDAALVAEWLKKPAQ